MSAPQDRPPKHRRGPGYVWHLYRRMQQANVTADETIAKYDESKARLVSGLTRAEAFAAKRDDAELKYLGGKAQFHSDLAVRMALTILVEQQMGNVDG